MSETVAAVERSRRLTSSGCLVTGRYTTLARAPRQSGTDTIAFSVGLNAKRAQADRVLTMMTLYFWRSGSSIVSLNSIPSVRYLILVLDVDLSSNRIVYPTCAT